MNKDISDILLHEIRENRKEIIKLKDDYTSFKIKIFGFVSVLTALIQIGAEYLRK
jgi:hypothetical protein